MARTGGDGGSRTRSISVSGKGSARARATKKPAPKYQDRLGPDRASGNASRTNRGVARNSKRKVDGYSSRPKHGSFEGGGYRTSGNLSPSSSKSPRVLQKRPRRMG